MKFFYDYSRIFLGFVVAVFMLQLPATSFTQIFLEFVHSLNLSLIGLPFFIIFKILNTFLLYFLAFVFCGHTIYVHPNWPDSLANLTFVCVSLGVCSCLQLMFAELRPFMTGFFDKDLRVFVECSPDFGMPSANIWMSVTLYQLYKVTFFQQSEKEKVEMVPTNEDQTLGIFSIRRKELKFGDRKLDGLNSIMTFSLFNKLSMVTFAIILFSQILLASQFLTQALLSFIFSYALTNIFVYYCRSDLRSYFKTTLLNPKKREKTSFEGVRFLISIVLVSIKLLASRSVFSNSETFSQISQTIQTFCGKGLVLSQASFANSLILFLPILLIILLNYTDGGVNHKFAGNKNKSFFDLTPKQKFLRIMIFFCLLIVPFFAMQIADLLLVQIVPDTILLIASSLSRIFFIVILSLSISILLPIALLEFDVLLKGEILTEEESFEDSKEEIVHNPVKRDEEIPFDEVKTSSKPAQPEPSLQPEAKEDKKDESSLKLNPIFQSAQFKETDERRISDEPELVFQEKKSSGSDEGYIVLDSPEDKTQS